MLDGCIEKYAHLWASDIRMGQCVADYLRTVNGTNPFAALSGGVAKTQGAGVKTQGFHHLPIAVEAEIRNRLHKSRYLVISHHKNPIVDVIHAWRLVEAARHGKKFITYAIFSDPFPSNVEAPGSIELLFNATNSQEVSKWMQLKSTFLSIDRPSSPILQCLMKSYGAGPS